MYQISRKKILNWLVLLFFAFCLFIFRTAFAAGPALYFKGSDGAVSVGDEFSVEILISSEQPVNVYSISLEYPADSLGVAGFNNANSIVDVRRDEPQVFEGGLIKFSGGSLKAFSGEDGNLLVINFKAIKSGQINLNFTDARVYLADGKGTKVKPDLKPIGFAVGEAGIEPPRIIEYKDTHPPTISILELTKDPITPGRRLLSFLVKDDVSGVKEVLYREKRWLWWGNFRNAQNPTPLSFSTWAVQVRAVDNAGNESSREIYDWSAFAESNFFVWFVIVLGLGLVMNRFVRRRGYNNRSNG